MAISTEKELGEALKNNQGSIEIEDDLSRKTPGTKVTRNVAWAVAIGAIGIAIVITVGSGSTAAPAAVLVGIGAVSVLRVSDAASTVI